jgi:2-isopropylmalate synthase
LSRRIELYDTTLRDGAQGPGIKFSSEDQLRLVEALSDFGVAYIEGGQPGSNPKAVELFERARDMDLGHTKITAFGSTRHSKSTVEDDVNIKALLGAGTEVIVIFAKSSPMQATEVLRIGLEENLEIIEESVAYLVSQDRRVFLDGEHFFDGYFEDSDYALTAMERGFAAGAEIVIPCDTNGGRLPWEISEAIQALRARIPGAPLGIHTHNDSGCGTANALQAVADGAVQVQGTINGYGERTGNANLCTIVPTLQLKMGFDVVTPDGLRSLTHLSKLAAELANQMPNDSAPFTGRDAFTHKGGMHADAVRKFKSSYEHIDPLLVGNTTTIPVSEVSGRSSLLDKAADIGIELDRNEPDTMAILQNVKRLESQGYEFEAADASLELLIRRTAKDHPTFFTMDGFHVSITRRQPGLGSLSEATVKLYLPGDTSRVHTAAGGDGPVDALDNALRRALQETYPELEKLQLEDYKVRILDSQSGTRAKTRVLIESRYESETWYTVGVSENIITASYEALADSFEFLFLRTSGHVDAQPAPSEA